MNNSEPTLPDVVVGQCILAASGYATDAQRRECLAQLDQVVAGLAREIDRLRGAILSYLDAPGCNSGARATAMAKLRWAAERRQ